MSGRRPTPEDAPPSASVATASARSSSLLRIACRYSMTSSSGISVLAQWIAPAPMQNRLTPRQIPKMKFCAPMVPKPGTKIVSVSETVK